MSDVVAMPPEDAAPESKSLAERFLGVFISPGATFADVARKPDFIAPMIVAVVMAIAVTETMLAKIGMERLVRMGIEQSGKASSMTPEQMDQALQQGVKFGSVIAHIGGVLGAPIFLLIIAALGLLVVNVIFGGKLNFKTSLSVASYAYLPAALGGLMALAMILFGDPEHFNAENPIPSNVGFFLNPLETSKALYKLATSIDIFSLWLLVLLGIGFSEATGRKVKTLSVFMVYLGLWMLWVLGKVGIAALTG